MKKIKLTQNKYALIDNEDYNLIKTYKWYAAISRKKYYAVTNLNNKTKQMHRLIMNLKKDQIIDHINGNGLDNRKSNLRLCSNKENARNRGKNINNTSGYKGVTWSKEKNKWNARICFNYKDIYLGDYKNIKDAARAYNEAAIKYHGEFAYLNEIKNEN